MKGLKEFFMKELKEYFFKFVRIRCQNCQIGCKYVGWAPVGWVSDLYYYECPRCKEVYSCDDDWIPIRVDESSRSRISRGLFYHPGSYLKQC